MKEYQFPSKNQTHNANVDEGHGDDVDNVVEVNDHTAKLEIVVMMLVISMKLLKMLMKLITFTKY